jgi:hypothetical protein
MMRMGRLSGSLASFKASTDFLFGIKEANMKKIWIHGVMMVILGIGVIGCASRPQMENPLNDKVLVYDLPYDLTYLRTMEALEKVKDWDLQETEKEKGFIRVCNRNFSRFDDADKRLVTVEVKRISRNQTSVSLAPQSQRVIEGDKLLDKIQEYLDREVSSPKL